jgi:hypothetical protein
MYMPSLVQNSVKENLRYWMLPDQEIKYACRTGLLLFSL